MLLHHNLDLEVKRKPRATGRVQTLGTTAKLPPGLGNEAWVADMEYVWRLRTSDALQKLHKRARSQKRAANREESPAQRVVLSRSAEWAEHRAQSLATPRTELLRACGKRWRKVKCGCGVSDVPVGCDVVMLCGTCRRVHWRRWRKRITRAMDAHVRSARAEWAAIRSGRKQGEAKGQLPGVYLITLTIPHSGSIIDDRAKLGKAWRGLTKVSQSENWWGAYALTYEVTPGRDGKGHVHAHIAAVSSWVPYDRLREVWYQLTGAVVLDVSAPRSGKSAKSAADYLAKYVTKGVEPSKFTGAKAGEMLVAVRGKRKVTTSIGFWKPLRDRETTCKRCGCEHRSMGAPPALRTVAPAAVLKAMAERIGWWVPRGAVQTEWTSIREPC